MVAMINGRCDAFKSMSCPSVKCPFSPEDNKAYQEAYKQLAVALKDTEHESLLKLESFDPLSVVLGLRAASSLSPKQHEEAGVGQNHVNNQTLRLMGKEYHIVCIDKQMCFHDVKAVQAIATNQGLDVNESQTLREILSNINKQTPSEIHTFIPSDLHLYLHHRLMGECHGIDAKNVDAEAYFSVYQANSVFL